MSAVELLLSRLEGVRDRGNGQWLARCPVHEDKSPSLSVKETSDGTVLIHCFTLCNPADIVAAVGLELSDLFPENLEPCRGKRPHFNARDLLLVIRNEATLIGCGAGQLLSGTALTDEELRRIQLAVGRIYKALGVANVR